LLQDGSSLGFLHGVDDGVEARARIRVGWEPDATESAIASDDGVGEHRELDVQMLAVRGEALRVVGEGEDNGKGITELVEVIAHDDQVFLAWQSSEVSVQDQHERSAAILLEAPPAAS